MHPEQAQCGHLSELSPRLIQALDAFVQFRHPDAMQATYPWRDVLSEPLPKTGVGANQVIQELIEQVIPFGSRLPHPGATSFITTGATDIASLATLVGAVASPQRIGSHAFNWLEEVTLQWLVKLFGLPESMRGVYSSGGTIATMLALGAARQAAYERRGMDVSEDGLLVPGRLFASADCHRAVQKAAAVLGFGRKAVVPIAVDERGCMQIDALRQQLQQHRQSDEVPVAIIANAGSTSCGAIDDLQRIAALAQEFQLWFHVDGAYGLPGILDPQVAPLYRGLEQADSVIVDPHKWLGAPVGIGATFVKNREILYRAFTQQPASYLEGSCEDTEPAHSLDSLGIPYSEFSLELSSPSRGVVVWAMLREIGEDGLRERICRHNQMAQQVAARVKEHPDLELLVPPTLSICCFRFAPRYDGDLNELNRRLHRRLIHEGITMPSTVTLQGKLAIRPCFLGARTGWEQADLLVDRVLEHGRWLLAQSSSKHSSPKHPSPKQT